MSRQYFTELPRAVRTVEQCRYLNGIAYKLICDHLGYERNELSDMLCAMYWGGYTIRRHGEFWYIPLRTTSRDFDGSYSPLEPREFFEFTEFVQRFGAKHGVVIPDPEVKRR